MRILDQILAGKSATALAGDDSALADFKRDISGMETFNIDNVAAMFYGDLNREWNIGRDLPYLAPPFSDFWMEYVRPPQAHLPHRVAMRFWEEPAARQKGARWALVCQSFYQRERHMAPEGPIGAFLLSLDDCGAFLSCACKPDPAFLNIQNEERAKEFVTSLCAPALLAISFLHCKNVTIQREQPPDPALARRQRERGQTPRVVFKTLNIAPMKAVLEKVMAETPGCNLKRALHICRGHFADYKERGLFGKLRGRFWISQHLRGDLNKGIVHKTYDVKAPAK